MSMKKEENNALKNFVSGKSSLINRNQLYFCKLLLCLATWWGIVTVFVRLHWWLHCTVLGLNFLSNIVKLPLGCKLLNCHHFGISNYSHVLVVWVQSLFTWFQIWYREMGMFLVFFWCFTWSNSLFLVQNHKVGQLCFKLLWAFLFFSDIPLFNFFWRRNCFQSNSRLNLVVGLKGNYQLWIVFNLRTLNHFYS